MGSPRLAVAGAFSVALVLACATASQAHFVYTANFASGDLSASLISMDGWLQRLSGSPFGPVPSADGLSISPDGQTLLATVNDSPGELGAFALLEDGSLWNEALFTEAGDFPGYSTIAPHGRFAYVSNMADPATDGTISAYELDDGLPVHLNDVVTGSGLAGIATSTDGRFVYAATSDGSANVFGYRVATDGNLTPLPGSPFDIGVAAGAAIAVSPNGRFVFVGDHQEERVAVGAIGGNGSLTPVGAPVTLTGTATYPVGFAVTPDGRFLLSANAGDEVGSVSAFAIASGGGLSPVVGSPFATSQALTGIAVTPDGVKAYAGGVTGVFGFSVQGTGALTPLTGSPFASGGVNDPDYANQTIAIAPNQGPQAAFSAVSRPPRRRNAFTFDSSASEGAVRFHWDFGDGKTATSDSGSVDHLYARDGAYQVRLRVTDSEGCSTSVVYTGQATLCNGGPQAVAVKTIKFDITGPAVSDIEVPKRFTRRRGKSLRIHLSVSEPAAMTFYVSRVTSGRRLMGTYGKCIRRTRKNRYAKRCTLLVTKWTQARQVQAGRTTLVLDWSVLKGMEPGTYRFGAFGTDGLGNRSLGNIKALFKVVAPKKPRPKKPRAKKKGKR
jgi:6-phosphogluconolactonase (cycloisomerase 2 family)